MKVHFLISGDVQGVNFRYYSRRMAEQLGLKGFVKNTFDGKVEIHIEGDDSAVKEMIAWVKKGPSPAYVTDVEKIGCKCKEFRAFEIRY